MFAVKLISSKTFLLGSSFNWCFLSLLMFYYIVKQLHWPIVDLTFLLVRHLKYFDLQGL